MELLLIVIIVLGALLACACCCLLKACSRHDFMSDPMPRRLPIIGNLTFLTNPNNGEAMKQWTKKNGVGCMGMYFGQYPVICLNDSKTFKDSIHDDFVGRMPNISMPMLWTDGEKSVKNSQPPEWYTYRHMMEVALKIYKEQVGHGAVISEGVDRLVRYFNKQAEIGKPFKPLTNIRFHGLNIANAIGIGKMFDEDDEDMQKMTDGFKFFVDKFNEGVISDYIPWLRKIRYPPVLTELGKVIDFANSKLQPVFDEHLQRFNEAKEDGDDDYAGNDLADIMLKLRRDNEEFHDVSDHSIYLMATADMSSGAVPGLVRQLEWLVIFLCNNPKWQDEIFAEIQEVCQGEPPCYEDLDKLPIVRAFVQESFRYNPVVIFSIPHRAQRAGQIGGFDVPQDTMVLQNLWAIHHNAKDWGDTAYRFMPERFLEKKKDEDWTYKYCPFSRGARMCPGSTFATETCRLYLAALVYHFEFPTRDIDEYGKGQPIECKYRNCPGIVCTRREVRGYTGEAEAERAIDVAESPETPLIIN